ncbi:MAG: tRNA lysidine(34) synthetase TilS [Acidovorax sp.]|jgi:tRNA(Ile)-lysidine synthase|nr:tRNA lysidine(34) synthetase TilS [Acidovorax sp.]
MTQSVDQAMQAFAASQPALPLAVAYSGGADSSTLLHACVRRWPGQVYAIHVHHGLQDAADGFEAHCRATCTALQVPLTVAHVDARPAAGDSPEDAARRYRYAALTAQALKGFERPMASMALAQHADDQVETLLLALSRGAGLPGLAAMPQHWQRGGLAWHRPLLQVAGRDVRQWLLAQDLPWVEDPTNTDARYTRNRIRHQLLPALEQVFPQFRDTFARSSQHAAQAQQLLVAQAQVDLQAVGVPPQIKAVQALEPERQAQLLRQWLLQSHGTTPTAAQLRELLRQISHCSTRGHRIHIKVGYGFVVRQGSRLAWYNP